MAKPKRTSSRPQALLSGNFSVRAGGAWVIAQVAERLAWEIFLDNCRTNKNVELLRGAVVVAQRATVQGESV